ncbi:sensor histidine kinase [Halorubrum sp. CBA1125]|uniref:sensor histidine kinase n=1 Tax=Halorubrum sp. CBA1125 TaxID=2668072 RepID=UPI001E3D82AC|nr:ATP-binding protein [Halorubrum sp. CBA1125]
MELPEANPEVPEALAVVVNNLIENAVVHNDAERRRVSVTATVDDEHARVCVSDNGPGIDEYELEVLESGTESALRHGSGLGLWLVKWGAETIGGSVSFESSESTGTTVTATVPLEETDHRAYTPGDR